MKATINDLKKFIEVYLPKDKLGRLKRMTSDQLVAIGRAITEINNKKLIIDNTRLDKRQIAEYTDHYKRHSDNNITIFDFMKETTKPDNNITQDVDDKITTSEVRYSKLHINIETDLYKEYRKHCIDLETTVTDQTAKLIKEYLDQHYI
jgi:hypothetical protein